MSWLGFETDKVNHRNIEKFAVLGAVILVAQDYGSELSRLQLIEQQSYRFLPAQ